MMAASALPRMLSKGLLGRKLVGITPLASSVRNLNLLEYQSKELLDKHGVTVQKFKMAESAEQAKEAVKTFTPAEYVIKAQILAGGRGKGTFDNGFKGGVHLTKQAGDVPMLVSSMAGHRLVTKQTPKDGIMVRKVMVAESVDILRETYFCILMDREYNGPVVIASPDGGVDIEEVAEKTPERLRTVPIDIHEGMTEETARDLAAFLNFHGELQDKAAAEIQALYRLFLAVDATQVEINPLIETPQGQVVAVDAKIQFDDNAAFRQKEIFAMEDSSESDPREVEAAKHNLNYIGMDGNIGCLVNGAGLAMATMDIIKLHGGEPANFLDCGGGVQEEQVKSAFQLLTNDKNVKAILVNVFGGIVNCATIANGIVNASKSISLDLPLVVRLEGTNVNEARKILADSQLPIKTATDLDDAAMKAVASL
ncbi:succinate--CoA ligase [GDP-forming] subunit beta, mitochondrial-like [Amphibalanus amphitrite]|uniref:succinate--CoA ligase [GDP-forming] subunit beta, mitochondrial-like n=1 Tax=Amphibalanus amphitrite TaxID=1232801 RepID=UPI001C90A2C5|nr:succinate--CoA ligase [GDP-forming] subunit beta, mitochondrial-like [Amphibalanus amphitrite]